MRLPALGACVALRALAPPSSSTNSWDHTIAAAPPEDMIDVALLSGNAVVESIFYDGAARIGEMRVRLYYDRDK